MCYGKKVEVNQKKKQDGSFGNLQLIYNFNYF